MHCVVSLFRDSVHVLHSKAPVHLLTFLGHHIPPLRTNRVIRPPRTYPKVHSEGIHHLRYCIYKKYISRSGPENRGVERSSKVDPPPSSQAAALTRPRSRLGVFPVDRPRQQGSPRPGMPRPKVRGTDLPLCLDASLRCSLFLRFQIGLCRSFRRPLHQLRPRSTK